MIGFTVGGLLATTKNHLLSLLIQWVPKIGSSIGKGGLKVPKGIYGK